MGALPLDFSAYAVCGNESAAGRIRIEGKAFVSGRRFILGVEWRAAIALLPEGGEVELFAFARLGGEAGLIVVYVHDDLDVNHQSRFARFAAVAATVMRVTARVAVVEVVLIELQHRSFCAGCSEVELLEPPACVLTRRRRGAVELWLLGQKGYSGNIGHTSSFSDGDCGGAGLQGANGAKKARRRARRRLNGEPRPGRGRRRGVFFERQCSWGPRTQAGMVLGAKMGKHIVIER